MVGSSPSRLDVRRHSLPMHLTARSLSCRLDRVRPSLWPSRIVQQQSPSWGDRLRQRPHPMGVLAQVDRQPASPLAPAAAQPDQPSASDCPEHSGCSWSISRTGCGVVWPHRHRTFSHRPRRVRIVQAIATTRSKGGTTDGMRRNITSTRSGSRVESVPPQGSALS